MFSAWRWLIKSFIITSIIIQLIKAAGKITMNPKNWAVVEAIAEEHPYIVALLNKDKTYMCTGTIISKRSVLTAGSCVDPEPYYIAVGAAVLSKKMNKNSLLLVAYTKKHTDYIDQLKTTDPQVSQMQNNVGLVFSVDSVLEDFVPRADMSNYFASEMQDATLTVFGYGPIKGTGNTVLQGQTYRQSPCVNPKWYYCICGTEFLTKPESEFGMGGPVIFNNEVAAIAVSPCGVLARKSLKYNIFTVTGAYVPWIQKIEYNPDTIKIRAGNNRAICKETSTHVYILTMLIKYMFVYFTYRVHCFH